MPTSSIQLPETLDAGPVRWLAWIALAVVVGFVLQHMVRPRSGASMGMMLRALATNVLRIAVFAAGALIVTLGMAWLAERPDALGSAASLVLALLCSTAAYVAGLFIARQFLAPPWWRLNAWEPGSNLSHDSFGIAAAGRWILADVRDLIQGMRLIDRIVVLGAIPLAGLWSMQVFGVTQTLQVALASLLVLYLALVVALFSANRIPRVLLTRLQDLRQVARRIAGGDLSARVSFLDAAEYEELGELRLPSSSTRRCSSSRSARRATR
jgi:hypothetical protein